MEKVLFSKSKKANLFTDSMLVLFVLIGVAVFSWLGYIVFNDLNSDIQADPDLNAQAKGVSSSLFARYPSFLEGAFLFMFVLLWVFVLVSSAMIDSHPMFFVVALILMVFALIVGLMLGNSVEEFAGDDEFAAVTPNFPIMYWFMTHIGTVLIVICASILLVLYGKNKFTG